MHALRALFLRIGGRKSCSEMRGEEEVMKPLVTVSREYGSGGRIIGAKIAERLGVPIYDKELIDLAAEKSGLSKEIVESAELKAKSGFTYSLSSAINLGPGIAYENYSINETLFNAQFDVVEQIGQLGEGVIVGRCADYVLKDIPNVTNIFIYGELEDRVRRCVEDYGDDPESVKKKIATYDKARANYYNYHTCRKWGDYRNYNLMVDSSYMGEGEIADLVVQFVKTRNTR